jgi:transcriptional regulator of met regulon
LRYNTLIDKEHTEDTDDKDVIKESEDEIPNAKVEETKEKSISKDSTKTDDLPKSAKTVSNELHIHLQRF